MNEVAWSSLLAQLLSTRKRFRMRSNALTGGASTGSAVVAAVLQGSTALQFNAANSTAIWSSIRLRFCDATLARLLGASHGVQAAILDEIILGFWGFGGEGRGRGGVT